MKKINNMQELTSNLKPKTVIILQGVSGSGKSTAVRTIFKACFKSPDVYDAQVVSADDFWNVNGEYDWDPKYIKNAHEWCFGQFIRMIRYPTDIVMVDNTNTCKREYEKYVSLAEEFGYDCILYQVHGVLTEEELLTCFNRNVHKVPFEAIKGQYERIQNDF